MVLFQRKKAFVCRLLLFPFGIIVALLPFLLFTSTTALAHSVQIEHAEYVSSTPALNAMLKTAPTNVVVHFSEDVNPSGSDMLIYDVNGKQVSTAAAQVERSDLKTMTIPMQANGSEVYVVLWHTVSAVEGHHDSGSFRFFVNISPMLQGMVNGHMTGGQGMGTSTSTSSSATPSSGIPLWSVILIGIVGIVVGGVATFVFLRLRPFPTQPA